MNWKCVCVYEVPKPSETTERLLPFTHTVKLCHKHNVLVCGCKISVMYECLSQALQVALHPRWPNGSHPTDRSPHLPQSAAKQQDRQPNRNRSGNVWQILKDNGTISGNPGQPTPTTVYRLEKQISHNAVDSESSSWSLTVCQEGLSVRAENGEMIKSTQWTPRLPKSG